MGINDKGLAMVGSFIRGLSPTSPGYAMFDAGSSEFRPDKTHADDEKLRKEVTWAALDNVDSRATVIVTPTELVGSFINAVGLSTGSISAGSDLVARDLSSFGEKTSYQNWILNFDWRNRTL